MKVKLCLDFLVFRIYNFVFYELNEVRNIFISQKMILIKKIDLEILSAYQKVSIFLVK